MRNRKKIISIIILTASLALMACGSAGLNSLISTNVKQAVKDRMVSNKQAADNLYNAGLMSQTTHDTIVSNIDSQGNSIYQFIDEKKGDDFTDKAIKAQERLLAACSAVYAYQYKDVNGTVVSIDYNDSGLLHSTSMAGNSLAFAEYAIATNTHRGTDPNTSVTDKMKRTLESLVCPIYVVKRDASKDANGNYEIININKSQRIPSASSIRTGRESGGYTAVMRVANGMRQKLEENVSNGTAYVGDDGITPIPLLLGDAKFTYYYDEASKLYVVNPASSTIIGDINQYVSCPVYILNWKAFADGKSTIENVCQDIQASKDQNSGLVDTAVLAKYFTSVSYKGSKLTLTDLSNPNNMIVNVSKDQDFNDNTQELGVDLGITQTCNHISGNLKQMSVKLIEFNQKGIDAIQQAISGTNAKYYFVKGNDNVAGSTTNSQSSAIYLMEYPVGIIDEMSVYNDEYLEATVDTDKSALAFNVMTGKYAKYSNAWDASISSRAEAVGVEITSTDSMYTGAAFDYTSDISSLKIAGFGWNDILKRGTGITDSNGVEKQETLTVKAPSFVLRDYMEAVYAPDIVSGEELVNFGRKYRFKEMTAIFYDSNGGPVDATAIMSDSTNSLDVAECKIKIPRKDTLSLYNSDGTQYSAILDTLDADRLVNWDSISDKSNATVDYIAKANSNKNNTVSVNNSLNNGGISGDLAELNKVGNLATNVVTSIHPTSMFGSLDSTSIDKADSGDKLKGAEKPLMYCISTNISLFELGLFDWLNSTAEDGNSVAWWNKWLSAHNYGYTIDLSLIQEYMKANYMDELAERGITLLDLGVIEKIQNDLNLRNATQVNETTRSFYVIVGVILVVLGLCLLVCWTLDTQSGIGCNILERVTQGHWVSISFDSEIPSVKVEEKLYITFTRAIVLSLVIIALGVILMFGNINLILYNILTAVKGIIDVLSDTLSL